MAEPTPRDKLEAALQEFVNETYDEACILKEAIVVFETTRFNDEGRQAYRVNYSIPTEGTGMSATVGLLEMGKALVLNELVGDSDG